MYREGTVGGSGDGTIEGRRRKLQLLFGVAWKKRQINKDALGERGFKFDADDVRRYEEKRSRHNAMKNVEHGVTAENMLLEGTDMEGQTEQKTPYHWFGDSVMAYPASGIDDVVRGVDGILMFIDQDDERLAHPIGIDVKTNRDDATGRITEMLEDVARGRGLVGVYWVDTASEPDSTSFDQPDPDSVGKVKVLRLALHIPAESAIIYQDESRPYAVADREMRRLGSYVRHQMACQLESMALIILGKVSLSDVVGGEVKLSGLMDQDELLEEITAGLGGNPDRDQMLEIIASSLKSIWFQQADNGDDPEPMPEIMPLIIRNLGQLRRTKKK